MPRLSVIMPVYNVSRYLAAAIDSVLAQTFADFELIVVNDGSKDDSLAIIQRAAARDSRVRCISRPNTGIVGALNEALQAASGEFVARMDGDDLCTNERFTTQIEFLENHPKVWLVGARVEFIDSEGARLKTYQAPLTDAEIRTALLAGNSGALIHPAIMGPRRAWTETGGYREPYKYVEDYDLFIRVAQHGVLANLEQPLLKYRIHAQSTNYQRRDQQLRLVKELCRQARASAGLPTDFTFNASPAHPDLSSVYREWTGWALEGGESQTARRYAWRAWLRRPWQLVNLRALAHTVLQTRRLSPVR
jgi:glycosyltransferase involved in cell wall biosynthesis